MSLLPREAQELEAEQELLRGAVAVARCWPGRLPTELLDAVLAGARVELPTQRPRPPD